VKRAALFIKMNEMVVGGEAVIPVVYRPGVAAMHHRLRATLSGWDNAFWRLPDWFRDGEA
jgi:peptide/nickel transport system substrate-binding protein